MRALYALIRRQPFDIDCQTGTDIALRIRRRPFKLGPPFTPTATASVRKTDKPVGTGSRISRLGGT